MENTLGTAYLGQQEWALAAEAFRRGLAVEPEEPLLLSNLAVAFLQDGNPDEAEVNLRAALRIDPSYPYARYNLGLIEANRGNFAAAAEHLETVAEFDADDVFTQYNLGVAYSSLGRSDDAVAAFRRALEVNPDHVSTLYALGRELVTRGEQDEGRSLISRSQEIRSRSGLDVAVGSQYGEQGPYALGADYPGDILAAPADIDVAFSAAQQHEAAAEVAWTVGRLAPDNGPVLVIADGPSLGLLSADSGFDSRLTLEPASSAVLSLAAGDGDNDAVVEVYALMGGAGAPATLEVIEQSESGDFMRAASLAVGESAGMPDDAEAADVLLVDREHDGDLDLFFCWAPSQAPSCAIATNDGSGGFDVRPASDYGIDLALPDAGAIHLALSDLDNDRDIDLLVGEPRGLHFFANQRDGSFAELSSDAVDTGNLGALAEMAVADIDKDGWMDVVIGAGQSVWLLTNERGALSAPAPIAEEQSEITALAVVDADNDGFLDIVAAALDGEIAAYRNRGRGEWRETTSWFENLEGEIPLAAFDADLDGDLDLATRRSGGSIALLRNDGGNARQWISIESRGVGDNSFGVGSKVEVLAGALRQKFEVTSALPIHAGLGSRTQVDSVRHLWPSGVLQDEIRQTSGVPVAITQLDRKGTSCPILYVWRDGNWEFVTDFLGGSAIGYQSSPGVFSTPDTDEYVKLPRAPSVDEDGKIRIRVNNQLQEIIWFDQLQLLAVDHPSGTQVFPNERLMPGPPWPDFGLFVSDDIRQIVSARSLEKDEDWTAELIDSDGRYVEDFALLGYKGYAEAHTLELDLGSFEPTERIVLLLDGWIDYADSTANVAASQAGLSLTPPVLTVADGQGGWTGTGHLMGFPAGLPKTMAVDLTGLFPSDDHRVRIATNMRIYWDQARILVGGQDISYDTWRLTPGSAELRYGGFPGEVGRVRGQSPYRYDPASVSDVTPWSAHIGRYTTFGDVTGLVSQIDDRMVTTKSGDEIELVFDAPAPPRQGQTRTFLLFADGFGKDMDPNSAANRLVGPLPFHGMPTYPYSDDVVPPVDVSDTMKRVVTDSERGWPGALPLPLAPVARAAD